MRTRLAARPLSLVLSQIRGRPRQGDIFEQHANLMY
jgi:hypothetical protein